MGKNAHEKSRKSLCRTIVELPPFLTSTEIRGQMAADYGINESVQTTRRRRNECEFCGRIAHKNHWCSTRI